MENDSNPFLCYGFKNEQEFREFIEKKIDYLVAEGIIGVNAEGKYYQKTDEELNKEVDNFDKK